MFDSIRRSVKVIGSPLATAQAEGEELAVAAMEEQWEEEEQAGKFHISSYRALFEMPSSQEEMELQLREQGYELSEPPRGGAGGLLVTRGKVVIDANGVGAGGKDEDERTYGYGQGSLNLGYILAQTRFFRIYPLLGVGGGGAGGDIEAEVEGEGEPSEGAQPAARPGFGMFNAGLGMDLTLRFWRLSLFAGLRVGVGIRVGQARAIVPTPFLRVITGASLHA